VAVVSIGVDIGQLVDPTAICVGEREERRQTAPDIWHLPNGTVQDHPRTLRAEEHHVIRYLERLPLGTPYPDVAQRIARVAEGVCRRTGAMPTLYIDATGVGTPVVDELRRAGVRARLWAVYFTHGDRRSETGREVHLGKAWLVSHLQALLQGARLHLPKTTESDALARELQDYEIKIDQNANDTYGAFKVGTHDDLVTALGLAVQPVRRWLAV
jgi:hypothetical protein